MTPRGLQYACDVPPRAELSAVRPPFQALPLRAEGSPSTTALGSLRGEAHGFPALVFIERRVTLLVSRNGHKFKSWHGLCEAISKTVRGTTAVLDGEVVPRLLSGPRRRR